MNQNDDQSRPDLPRSSLPRPSLARRARRAWFPLFTLALGLAVALYLVWRIAEQEWRGPPPGEAVQVGWTQTGCVRPAPAAQFRAGYPRQIDLCPGLHAQIACVLVVLPFDGCDGAYVDSVAG